MQDYGDEAGLMVWVPSETGSFCFGLWPFMALHCEGMLSGAVRAEGGGAKSALTAEKSSDPSECMSEFGNGVVGFLLAGLHFGSLC